MPKYAEIWDVATVFSGVSKNAKFSQRTAFKNGYQKSYYAAMFTDGSRCQTVH